MGLLDIFGNPERAASPNEAWQGWQRVQNGLPRLINALEAEFGQAVRDEAVQAIDLDSQRAVREQTAQRISGPVINETVNDQRDHQNQIYLLTEKAKHLAGDNPSAPEEIDELAA
jgi:hypothetical protein